MQKKRILVVAASLGIGGAEKVARDICLYGDPEQNEAQLWLGYTCRKESWYTSMC